jgi:N-acetylmuramoyl-L-alanine amidase
MDSRIRLPAQALVTAILLAVLAGAAKNGNDLQKPAEDAAISQQESEVQTKKEAKEYTYITTVPRLTAAELEKIKQDITNKKIKQDITKKTKQEADLKAQEAAVSLSDDDGHMEVDSDTGAGWSASDRYLLAKIAMAEAESEDVKNKALVIRVVLNRVESKYFPDSIEGVIFESGQFSPISDGRWDKVEPDDSCYEALALVESGWDKSQGALFFELTTSSATWHSTHLKLLFSYRKTSFYTMY